MGEKLVIPIYEPDSIYLLRLVNALDQNVARPNIKFWPGFYYTKQTEICES